MRPLLPEQGAEPVSAGGRAQARYLLVVVLFAAVVASLSYLTYNEYYGGADEGCYTTMGYLLSRGNGFMPVDPVVVAAGGWANRNWFLPHPYRAHVDKSGRIMAQWVKGYPLLTAPLWRVFGYPGHKLWNPLAAGLLLVLTFLLLVTMSTPAAGVAAALLLGTSWIFLWHARYPMSEMTSALLFMLAALLIARHRVAGGYWRLWISGLVVGYATWVHAANLVLLPAFALWVILAPASAPVGSEAPRRPRLARGAVLVTVLLLPLFLTGSYRLLDPGSYMVKGTARGAKPAEIAEHSSVDFFRWEAKPFLRQHHVPDALGTPYFALLNAKLLPWATTWNLLVPMPFTLLACLGLPLALRNPRWRPLWLGLLVCAGGSLFVHAARDVGNPHVLYTARRFLPSVLPVAALLAGVALSSPLTSGRWCGRAIAWGFVIALAGAQFSTHAAFYRIRKGNSTRQVAVEIRRAVQAEGPLSDSLVVLSAYAGALGSGLRYIEGVPIVNGDRARPADLATIIAHELRAGKRVYLLAKAAPPEGVGGPGVQWRRVFQRRIVEHDPNSPAYTYPRLGGWADRLSLFRAEPDLAQRKGR